MKREKTKRTRTTTYGSTVRTYKGFAIESIKNKGDLPYRLYTSERFTLGETAGTFLEAFHTLKGAKSLIDSGYFNHARGENSVVAMTIDAKLKNYNSEYFAYLMLYRVAGDLWVSINGRKKFAVIDTYELNGDTVYSLAPNHTYTWPTVRYRTV